jgi:hypothetical protein
MTRPKENSGAADYASVATALARHGLLLKQDKVLASVVTMLTGGPLSASWWGHPQGRAIFACLGRLADDPDVLVTKLVSRKDTFVHRPLWSAVLAVATAREPWQLDGLSPESRKLWRGVEREGEQLASGKAATDLEARLLVHAEQVHTESGAHKNRLESWQAWSERMGFKTEMSPEAGRERLEQAVRAIGGTGQELPWRTRRARRSRD